MSFNNEAVAALPVSTAADKALIRAMCTRRFAYILAGSEAASNFVAVDPGTGVVTQMLWQNNISFLYDSTDSTTTADGVTCLVSFEGKRYKSATITPPYSVLTRATVAQPVSPAVGDTYLIPTAATGAAWAGKDASIGIYTAAGWVFATSPIGRFLYVKDETAFYHRNAAGTWTAGVGSIALGPGSVPITALLGANASFVIKVENQTTNTPPVSPVTPTAYIIGSSPTGAWAGNAGSLAICLTAGTFTIIAPVAGDTVYDKALLKTIRFDGTQWNAGADAFVLIQTQLAASSATIDFTTGLDDTYDAFEFRLSSVKPATDDQALQVLIGTGVGPSWQSSGYTYATHIATSAAAAELGGAALAFIQFSQASSSGNAVSSDAGCSVNGVVRFNNPEASDFCTIGGNLNWITTSGGAISGSTTGFYATAGAITGIRFKFASGNIAAGRFSLYGIRKS